MSVIDTLGTRELFYAQVPRKIRHFRAGPIATALAWRWAHMNTVLARRLPERRFELAGFRGPPRRGRRLGCSPARALTCMHSQSFQYAVRWLYDTPRSWRENITG